MDKVLHAEALVVPQPERSSCRVRLRQRQPLVTLLSDL